MSNPMNLTKTAKAWFVMLLCMISSIFSYAQPTANFTSNITSGCGPLVVSFIDNSSGNPTSWNWNFGDPRQLTPITGQNPSWSFFNPGQYTITLTVSNASGTNTTVRTAYINVYAKPTINFSATPENSCPSTIINFTDLTTPGSGTINSWQWSFGNGGVSSAQNPTYQFNNSGIYDVSLTVSNTFGCRTAITRDSLIRIFPKPTANYTFSAIPACSAPQTINFTNQSSGTSSGPLNYHWNFGDGFSSTEINPIHVYNSTGIFSPQLIVTNQNGCADTLTRTNIINILNNVTSFTIPDTICANTIVPINNNSTTNTVNINWFFGDGTTSNAFSPTKTYLNSGTYTIKLKNNFGACTDSMIKTITVLPEPTAFFTSTSIRNSCMAPLTINFLDSNANASEYLWNFGDGNTSTSQNPTHTYLSPGEFTVTLTTTAANGCTKTSTLSNYVVIRPPVVTINQMPRNGCAPLECNFHHSITGTDSVASFLWNFGDSTTSTLASPTHVFDSGAYTITLIVTTTTGCTDTVTYIDGIKAGVAPNADFSATPRNVCPETPVVFTDQTTPSNGITQWQWEFGDGGTSSTQNPEYTYSDTGYFDVQLISFNNGCADTTIIEDYIHVLPPIAKFKILSNCIYRSRRTFADSSIGADTWLWNFGDGNTSTQQNPVHDYDSSGIYTITLTVHNSITGCDNTISLTTNIINEIPNISATDTVICRGESTIFSAGVNNSYFQTIKWSFGDGTFSPNSSPSSCSPITKNYNIPGMYTVKLYTLDKNGCKDTTIKLNYILVNGPIAKFNAISSTNICSGANICFRDSSTSDGRNGLAYWIWNFGDGSIDTTYSRNICHTYLSGGTFNVKIRVYDSSGCFNTFTRPSMVTVYQPTASFYTLDTVGCPNRNITFNNNSVGSGLTYDWNFGDGSVHSNVANPIHLYRTAGLYTVKLIVFDDHGCSDTIIRQNYVSIVMPRADFTVSDTISTCPPLVVNFSNTSTNYNTYVWNFGAGAASNLANPSTTYTVAGNYNASLSVTGPGGCVSVKSVNIRVGGPRGSFTYGGLSGCAPYNINLNAVTFGASNFVWDYSDGNIISSNNSNQIHTYERAGAYVPRLILSDSMGCVIPIIGRDTVRIYDIRTGFNFNSTPLCDNGTVNFNNTTIVEDVLSSLVWNFGDGNSSNDTNPSHNYSQTGSYTPMLIATTLHGCKDTTISTIPVKVVATPQGFINQTANGCVNLNVRFNGLISNPDTSAISWNWDFGNGNTSSLISPQTQLYNTPGTYPIQLLITNSSGCKDTVLSNVEAYAIPNIDAGIDTMICKGRGATMQATGGNTYSWYPATGLSCTNCASPIANPANPIQYFVTGTSIHGCVNRDSVKVTVKYPFNMSVSPNDTICVGSSVKLTASGANTYEWIPATGLNNSTTASPLATPLTTTTYQVIGTDERNCFKDTAYIPVIVYNYPTVEAGADRVVNVGQSIDLIPQISNDVIDARWSPTGGIFRDIFPGITIKPVTTTTYTVVVKNKGGCTSSDQLTVNVLCNGANMFIPNTFSPNGDGMNDLFYPRGSGIFTIKNIKIFSRWGEIIFEKENFNPNDASKAWDGTYKGKKLNPDVYVYMLEVVCENNEKLLFKGNVAIIK